MTETTKPESDIHIKTSNGNHSLVAPVKGVQTPELPEGFWRGCTADGTPRDPAHPWHWDTPRKNDA